MADYRHYYYNNQLANVLLLVSFVFGVVFYDMGMTFKFVFLPFLVYLLAFPREENMPALIIMMSFGTVLTVFGAVFVIAQSFWKLTELKHRGLFRLWLILILMLPFYLFNSLYRMLSLGYSFADTLVLNDYYLAFWFVLYGATHSHLVTRRVMNHLLFPFIVLTVLLITEWKMPGGIKALFRLTQFSEATFYFIAFKFLTKQIDLSRVTWLKISLVIFFLIRYTIGLSGYKFTFFFGLIISTTFLYNQFWFFQTYPVVYYERLKRRARFWASFPIPFLIVTLILTPILAFNYMSIDLTGSYFQGGSVIDKILAKLFVDRGLLWIGAIDSIIKYSDLLPPLEEWKISFISNRNTLLEVDFESHNLILGLVRYNGYLFGVILAITYMRRMYLMMLNTLNNDPIMNIYRISLFGIGIAVFITGQYTLSLNTSFFFMGMVGAMTFNKDSITVTDKVQGILAKTLS